MVKARSRPWRLGRALLLTVLSVTNATLLIAPRILFAIGRNGFFTRKAAIVSAGGVMGLGLWAGAVEMIRFGDTHASYRADRLPWSQHTLGLFVSGVIVFWAIALVRYRRLAHQAELYAVEENHRVSLT